MGECHRFPFFVAYLLAVTLLAGAAAKDWDVDPTIRVLIAHWGLSAISALWVVWVLIGLETGLGAWLVGASAKRGALVVTGFFLIAVSSSPALQWLRHDLTSCGCGLPEWASHPLMAIFGRNLPLALAAFGAAWPIRVARSAPKDAEHEEGDPCK